MNDPQQHPVRVTSIISGEYHENEVRKDFTYSERVAIAAAVQAEIGNRQGERTDQLRDGRNEVPPGKQTREIAAAKAGLTQGEYPTPSLNRSRGYSLHHG